MSKQVMMLDYLTRGRADGLVAVAAVFGWSDGKAQGIGRKIGLSAVDVRDALARSRECAQVPTDAPLGGGASGVAGPPSQRPRTAPDSEAR